MNQSCFVRTDQIKLVKRMIIAFVGFITTTHIDIVQTVDRLKLFRLTRETILFLVSLVIRV